MDEQPSRKALVSAVLLRLGRISPRQALIYLATHAAIPMVLAYLAAIFAVHQTMSVQFETEAQLLNQLTLAARHEAAENANDIGRWQASLLRVVKPLETFINERESSRPQINPGYSRLRTHALGALVDSPIATRHMRPCAVSTIAQLRIRLIEANRVHTAADAALIEYTATFPQPLEESYSAAARLHAHIEQLLKIYEGLPDRLHLVSDHDPWPCVHDYQSESSGHTGKTTN